MQLDAFSEDFAADPYPHYTRLRLGAAAQREVQPNGMVSWLVPCYDDVRTVLTDPRFSSSFDHADIENLRRGGIIGNSGRTTLGGVSMILSDPPVHTRLRRLVSRAFTIGRVEALRPRVQMIADRLIDGMAPNGRADLIAEYARPLPVTVICELLGIAPDAHDEIQGWMAAMLTTPTSTAAKERREQGANALSRFLAEMVTRRQPFVNLALPEAEQPDLLSALIRARDGEGRLDERELVTMMVQLLVAGYETTMNLIGNGILALLQHADQMALMRERPDLLPSAMEEFLRFDSPVPRASYRVPLEDVQVGGVPIPAGSLISPLLGCANRDPKHFSDPARLDVARRDHQHVAFAYGIHYCLGAPLARVEGQVAIGSLLQRLPDLRLSESATITWRKSSLFIRGLERLPVEFAATG